MTPSVSGHSLSSLETADVSLEGLIDTVSPGDALEGMRRMPDDCVDVAIVDPPYNLSKGGNWEWDRSVALPGFGGAWQKTMADWDDLPLHEYFRFTLSWLSELNRLVKPTGSYWLHGTYHNSGIMNFGLQMLEIEMINEVIWYKRNSFPNLSGRRLTASHETIIWAHSGKKREYKFNYDVSKSLPRDYDRLNVVGKQMRTVWDIPNNKKKEELRHGKHPTQKPLRVSKRMLAISAAAGDVCLVPFAGSGTECVAAIESGLHFVAFENDPEFVTIARKRIADAVQNGQEQPSV